MRAYEASMVGGDWEILNCTTAMDSRQMRAILEGSSQAAKGVGSHIRHPPHPTPPHPRSPRPTNAADLRSPRGAIPLLALPTKRSEKERPHNRKAERSPPHHEIMSSKFETAINSHRVVAGKTTFILFEIQVTLPPLDLSLPEPDYNNERP